MVRFAVMYALWAAQWCTGESAPCERPQAEWTRVFQCRDLAGNIVPRNLCNDGTKIARFYGSDGLADDEELPRVRECLLGTATFDCSELIATTCSGDARMGVTKRDGACVSSAVISALGNCSLPQLVAGGDGGGGSDLCSDVCKSSLGNAIDYLGCCVVDVLEPLMANSKNRGLSKLLRDCSLVNPGKCPVDGTFPARLHPDALRCLDYRCSTRTQNTRTCVIVASIRMPAHFKPPLAIRHAVADAPAEAAMTAPWTYTVPATAVPLPAPFTPPPREVYYFAPLTAPPTFTFYSPPQPVFAPLTAPPTFTFYSPPQPVYVPSRAYPICATVNLVSPYNGLSVGDFTFYQAYQGAPTRATLFVVGAVGTIGQSFGEYHIHEFPVNPNDPNGPCSASSVGGHYNPTGITDYRLCNPSIPSTCEVGDLSGKFGNLASSFERRSFSDASLDLAAVLRKSLVIHDNSGARWVCGTIVDSSYTNPSACNPTPVPFATSAPVPIYIQPQPIVTPVPIYVQPPVAPVTATPTLGPPLTPTTTFSTIPIRTGLSALLVRYCCTHAFLVWTE
jgi:Cu/Zn superoxide dismutase